MINLQEEKTRIQKEITNRTMGYILGGLGLVVGLAWNDAIKVLIEYIFPLSRNTLLAKFLYAALLTLFVVILTTYFLRKNDEQH
ncbi:MAG: DUF5654 family protein [Patescibacteria group bacterium]|nr:DUF5654 family protein [bacterium]MDZ4240689.1 DUF5654 family protein [Patescibacteria group bacterium]